jgi:predicted Rossmann fold flavoprotein
MSSEYDVIIIGAGAAGMMCAIEAGKRGRKVWLVDHAKKLAEKIRISGGGRCNFTNIHTGPEHFLSNNPHFCKSALSRYTPADFIQLVKKHGIAYHEKALGQLFCDEKSQNIIDMLVQECTKAGVRRDMETTVDNITASPSGGYEVQTSRGTQNCASLVIATGGLSIPKIGATKFGYEVAKQFGLNVLPTRAGLVPLTFQADLLEQCKTLSGLSIEATVRHKKTAFSEGFLFTHRGLSGPSILQISSYWQEGSDIEVNLAPAVDVLALLKDCKTKHPKQSVQTPLYGILPRRLVQSICENHKLDKHIAELSDKALSTLADAVNRWRIRPSGTEGYRTAEVTLGGVDTNDLSSKTMEAKKQPGLYFIGEVVDVTGHLGGFNFQWAWSSGYVAGQNV